MSKHDETVARIGKARQQRIREKLGSWRKGLAEEGKAYPNLDEAAYVGYVVECFLRAMAKTPLGKSWVLKGGRLAAIRDRSSPLPHRPTLDVDLQRIAGSEADLEMQRLGLAGAERLRREVASVVDTDAFRVETGLVFEVDGLVASTFKDGLLADAYRLEGWVSLGIPGPGSPRVRFTIEVNTGALPQEAYETVEHPTPFGGGEPFRLLAARVEWQVAEKLHAVVSRSDNNSRYKDWYDLINLARTQAANVDPHRLRVCLDHVFLDEFKGVHPLPARCSDVSGLTPAKATEVHERAWQGATFRKMVGRDFDPARDPSLLALVGATAASLERLGAIPPSPAGEAARAVADLVDLCLGDLFSPGAPSAFADAFDRLTASAPDADRDEIAFRVVGEFALRGQPPAAPAPLLADAFEKVRASGMCARLPDAAALKARFAAIADRLAERPPEPTFLARPAAAKAPATASPATVAPKVNGKPTPTPQDVAKALSSIAPGGRAAATLNGWLMGLAVVGRAVEAGVQLPAGAEIAECPRPGLEAAVKVWIGMGKAQGVSLGIEEILDAVRGTTPAPAM